MQDAQWIPDYPITSSVHPRISVNSYDDIRFSNSELFVDGDLAVIRGHEAFSQNFLGVILSKGNERFPFAITSNIFDELSNEDFSKEAESLATKLVNHSYRDEVLLGKQTGLGHTIEQILSISRRQNDGKWTLSIELTATDAEQPLTITVPFPAR